MFRNLMVRMFLLSAFVMIGCGSEPATQENSIKPPAPTMVPIAEHTSVDPKAMAGLSWWHNEELVDELGLDSAQQQKMDGRLGTLLLQWQPNMKMRKGARRRFAEAVRAGDFDKARKVAEDLGKAEAFFSSGALVLKTEVLAELRPEQLQLLIEKHPRILKSRWISSSKLKTNRQEK